MSDCESTLPSELSDVDDYGGSEDAAGSSASTAGVAFEHFKASHDPAWDYEKICKDMFREDEKYLCVLEKVSTNPHVHFQGTPRDPPKVQDRKRKALAETHYKRALQPLCHPIKKAKRAVDEIGFQYINKAIVAPQYILARNGFTDQELADLQAKSKDHVNQLKYSVTEWVLDLPVEKIVGFWQRHEDVNKLLRDVCEEMFEASDRGELEIPKYNRKYSRDSVINGLTQNKSLPKRLRAALFSHA